MADALLAPAVGVAMWGLSAGAMAYSIKKCDISERKLPLMAVSGAFVFAAQMINFTIPGTGSSGHIGGGILLAGLLGELPAMLTIAAVLLIQCLFFADGGLLALGANIFNMGVIPCLIVYPLVFRPIINKAVNKNRISLGAILSAVIGLQLGAFCVVLETSISQITQLPFTTFVMLMQPIHLAIGLVEGIVTAAVLAFVYNARPEIIKNIQTDASYKKVVIALAVFAVVIGGALSLFASSKPDGLEWSMEKTSGTAELEAESPIHMMADSIQSSVAFLPDYDFKSGNGNGTSAAGVIGAVITCGAAFAVGGVIRAVKKRNLLNK